MFIRSHLRFLLRFCLDFAEKNGFPLVMTADTHTRALDRVADACDSNRIYDNGCFQQITPIAALPYYSIVSPAEVSLVEQVIHDDPMWGRH